MNNREAIALLRNLEDSLDSYCELNEEGKTVFRMAIEALNCSEIPNNSDTISRRAALDAIMGQPPEPHYPSWYAAQIEKLPAVQPATNYSEIPNGSDDTISRQAAIDDVCKMMYECFGADDEELDAIEVTLCELPAVQPDHVADIGKKAEGDCISRQAAIDALKEAFNPSITNFVKAKIAIDKLASAQPEIIRCKDCRFNDGTAYCLFHFRDVNGEGYCSWAERRTDG